MLFSLLIAVCISIFGALHAANPISRLDLAGEWLYMLPSIDQPYFVIDRVQVSPMEFEEERFRNHQDWHSGYRVELNYAFNCDQNDLILRWTYFPTFSDSRVINGDALIAVVTIPAAVFPQLFNQATKKDTFDFHYLDFLFGQTLIKSSCFNLDLQGGFQYGYLKLEENLSYIGNDNEVVGDCFISRLRGVGFEFGSQLTFRFIDCLQALARGYASFLVSEREVRRERVIFQNGLLTGLGNLKNEDYWTIIPTINARLALIYSYPYSRSCIFSFEGGYEMIFFFNGIDRIFFTNPEPPQSGSIDQLMNFTLHGPYLRFGICY